MSLFVPRRWLRLVAVLAGAACGVTAKEDPGSETHWLSACQDDGDCGADSCLCGYCSATCSADEECSRVGSAAGICADVVESSLACPDAEPRICLPQGFEAEPDASSVVPIDASEPVVEAELCDGSDNMRFAMVLRGGADNPETAFFAPVGAQMLAIDGKCHIWVSQFGVVREAELGDGTELDELLAFGKLSSLDTKRGGETCAAQPTIHLWDVSGAASCPCDCPTSELQRVADAAESLLVRHFDSGSAYDGPLSILLKEQVADLGESIHWQAEFEPSELILPATPKDIITAQSGYVVLDVEDRAYFREVWNVWHEREPYPERVPMSFLPQGDEQELRFYLYLRDELPDAVLAALGEAAVNL